MRIPPPILMLLCAVAMWLLAHHLPLWRVVPPAWNYVGWWVMDVSLIVPVLAFAQFTWARTTINPVTPASATRLVTSGVYAWTRNPMYLGVAILLVGWALRLGMLSAFLGPPVFVMLIRHFQIPSEERALRLRFDRQYEQYCRRVRRWFGRTSVAPG